MIHQSGCSSPAFGSFVNGYWLMLLLEVLGWWLVAALFFGGVAWSLGAKKWWVAFLVGLALGIATQLLFGEGLGLFLPRGMLFDAWYGPGPLFG